MLKRLLYVIYRIEWFNVHSGSAFKGCTPACYNEWKDCELADMLKHPEYYEPCWYYPIIKRIISKTSRYTKTEIIEPLILEPEDWTPEEWEVILVLFGMKTAERIVVSNYTLETFGVPKGE